MPTVYAFFAIDCQNLTPPMSIDAVQRDAVHWETVESRLFDGFEHIDRAFGREVSGKRYGTFSQDETKELAAALASASSDIIAKLEEHDLVAEFYWAMRRTAEEATRQNVCLSVRYTADPEAQEVAARRGNERIRAEDAEAEANVLEEISPYLPLSRALIAELEAQRMVAISKRASREEMARQLAEFLVDRNGLVGDPVELVDWFIDHIAVEDVFGDDVAFGALIATVQGRS